ncbi:tetratricopeptide repeat protein [Candidatus Uabimicrobium amorphum]|uniref:Tetratricopeptide repeat domain protein n=1 Tax=Uabimicrobium amorphum TaxID=2596890 RepID=A0A5S9ISJ5_UABAM|nr:tetratricopeptide repeat protein [Candidatus Uabimicrobium amorphum]BBM86632.1 tetratricopeptide repeat domain protein [Candidatus Uabimicrobium amorphum]
MQFQKNTPINQHLANLFASQKAVVFAGAGISLEPPAGLPDWNKLRDYTLEAVSSRDAFLQKYFDVLVSVPMIASPGKKGLTPEVVASKISENCYGYFECFRALKDGQPNANHRYLAKMAKNGLLKYIITTNFDVFIEKALEQENIDYVTYRTQEEFASFPQNFRRDTIHIIKIHGCISEPRTITATVEQEAKGLLPVIGDAIELLLADYGFVFWGYSGADLKIDLDYLRMVSASEKAQGFVWNFLELPNYKEPINPNVEKLDAMYGEKAYVVHGKLPDIFDHFIAESDQIERTKYSAEEEKSWREQKNVRFKNALTEWATQHLQQVDASSIYGRLLQHSGKTQEAIECLEHQLKICQDNSGSELEIAKITNNIGLVYHGVGEYHKALDYFEKAKEIAQKTGSETELARSLNNLGLIYSVQGKLDDALAVYLKVLDMNRKAISKKNMGSLLGNIGMIYHDKKHHEQALKYLQEAVEIARELGDKYSLATRLNNIGSVCSNQQKHDEALKYYLESLEITRILGDKKGLGRQLNNIGAIYYHQKKYYDAVGYYVEAEKICKEIGDKKILGTIYSNRASIFLAFKNFNEGLNYAQKGLDIMVEIGDFPMAAATCETMGIIHEDVLRDYAKAIKCYEESIQYYTRIGRTDKTSEMPQWIAECRAKGSL